MNPNQLIAFIYVITVNSIFNGLRDIKSPTLTCDKTLCAHLNRKCTLRLAYFDYFRYFKENIVSFHRGIKTYFLTWSFWGLSSASFLIKILRIVFYFSWAICKKDKLLKKLRQQSKSKMWVRNVRRRYYHFLTFTSLS